MFCSYSYIKINDETPKIHIKVFNLRPEEHYEPTQKMKFGQFDAQQPKQSVAQKCPRKLKTPIPRTEV